MLNQDASRADYSPSLDLWESQATYFPALVDSKNAPGMRTARFESGNLLYNSGHPSEPGRAPGDTEAPLYWGDSMVLQSLLELRFDLPEDTALVSVQGPIGSDPEWYKGAYERATPLCTYLLDPQPSWINSSTPVKDRYPLAWQEASKNEPNQTLFLVPLDPSVKYQMKVLPRYNYSVCVVSGFNVYSSTL